MIKVFIIGKTQVDFPTLLSVVNQTLGRSISRSIDESKTPAKVPIGYIASLVEFKTPNSKMVAAIRNPGFSLLHIHYTFLVLSTPEIVVEIQQQTNLQMLSEKTATGISVALVTGSLDQWRSSIINTLTENCSLPLRLFMDACVLEFDKEGLGPMFQGFDRVPQSDNTFRLKLK